METNQTPETATINGETENPKMTACTTPLPAGAETSAELVSVSKPDTPSKEEKSNYKLTDEQFIAELELNLGLYTQTACSIERHYGIKYTRQAVFQRAARLNRFEDIYEKTLLDNAKEVLFDAVTSPNTNEKQRIKAAIFFLSKTVYKR